MNKLICNGITYLVSKKWIFRPDFSKKLYPLPPLSKIIFQTETCLYNKRILSYFFSNID